MPRSRLKHIPMFSNRIALVVMAFFFAFSATSAFAKLPRVLLVENHSDVLVPWAQTGVRGGIVVNMDARDDCTPIVPENIGKLKRIFATGDMAALGRANGVADSGLYNMADYISAAYALGIVGEVVWAISTPSALSQVSKHLPFWSCGIDSLATLRRAGPVLLTVDAGCVDHYANYQCINLIEALRRIAKAASILPLNVVHVSVAFSCDGGSLPITMRWMGNAVTEVLEGKDPSRPNAPWPLLVKVEDWRRSLLPREIVRRVKPLVLESPNNPWLRVYLADALFRSDDVSGALIQGKEAARLDPGCCRILPDIGGQLANAGRLEEAERFINAAPAVVNAAAEIALAQGLDRVGHTARAIEHYSRLYKVTANYSVDLMIGYGYERLGDTTEARQHYLRAVYLLANPVAEMPSFGDLTLSAAASERFLLARGYQKEAQSLRRDSRLGIYFNKDAGGTSGH